MDEISKKKKRSIILGVTFQILLLAFLLSSMTILVTNAIVSTTTRDALIDCVDPEGHCFQEGQERTAGVVQQLIESNQLDETATRRVVVLAAVCAEERAIRLEPNYSIRIKLMEECVNEQLDKDKKAQEGAEP